MNNPEQGTRSLANRVAFVIAHSMVRLDAPAFQEQQLIADIAALERKAAAAGELAAALEKIEREFVNGADVKRLYGIAVAALSQWKAGS